MVIGLLLSRSPNLNLPRNIHDVGSGRATAWPARWIPARFNDDMAGWVLKTYSRESRVISVWYSSSMPLNPAAAGANDQRVGHSFAHIRQLDAADILPAEHKIPHGDGAGPDPCGEVHEYPRITLFGGRDIQGIVVSTHHRKKGCPWKNTPSPSSMLTLLSSIQLWGVVGVGKAVWSLGDPELGTSDHIGDSRLGGHPDRSSSST